MDYGQRDALVNAPADVRLCLKLRTVSHVVIFARHSSQTASQSLAR